MPTWQSTFFLLLGRAANELYHFAKLPRVLHAPAGMLSFVCNFCDRSCSVDLGSLMREERTCLGCGSTLRQRALLATLSRKLFGGKVLPVSKWRGVEQVEIIGISDDRLLAEALDGKVRYKNTFLHQPPVLNLCAPTEPYLKCCDVVICSDVLEHVKPPVEDAFAGLRRVLRPGGFALITVPCSANAATREHFPELHDYRILNRGGQNTLINRTADGRLQEFPRVVFHGGPGETLEMREFALADLEQQLCKAGFRRMELFAQPAFEHGVYWCAPYPVPVVAS